ncbi:MAG: CAP domain-containing protein [Oscillospiraceae bacterium]|nr:CAP domain-containing protein [Oscillospiraceae bacterium]
MKKLRIFSGLLVLLVTLAITACSATQEELGGQEPHEELAFTDSEGTHEPITQDARDTDTYTGATPEPDAPDESSDDATQPDGSYDWEFPDSGTAAPGDFATTPEPEVTAPPKSTSPPTPATSPTTTHTTPAEPTPRPVAEGGEYMDEIAREILTLVNAERREHGLKEVSWDTGFAETAKTRVTEIPLRFESDHRRPDGTTWDTAVREAGIAFTTIGENMARGGHSRKGADWYTPETVMESWMKSPGHRANILSEKYKLLGVSCYDLDGTRYYVQHFGTRR